MRQLTVDIINTLSGVRCLEGGLVVSASGSEWMCSSRVHYYLLGLPEVAMATVTAAQASTSDGGGERAPRTCIVSSLIIEFTDGELDWRIFIKRTYHTKTAGVADRCSDKQQLPICVCRAALSRGDINGNAI